MLAGTTYQGVSTALERRAFPRPGGLVSIGEHQLHLYCVGDGSPTVLLEAPAAGTAAAWSDVQQPLAGMTRACSYDRSGLGWSEAGDRPHDPGRVPEELRTLLTAARENGPFIVAGHGLGAAYARMYAARPDGEVVGLVLVDPPDPEAADDMRLRWIVAASPWLARVGVLRAGGILSHRADTLAGASGDAMRAFLNRPDHLTRAAAEFAKWDDAVRLASEVLVPGDLPVVTVTRGAHARIAFLASTDAARVVSAIADAIRQARVQ
jgi:pimeloyl-ACP methyl ester carboxylesterase